MADACPVCPDATSVAYLSSASYTYTSLLLLYANMTCEQVQPPFCDLASNEMWPADVPVSESEWQSEERNWNVLCDYIVVGAGAGGSALAYRLSSDESKTVCVFEAGDDPPIDSKVPSVYVALLPPQPSIFDYRTEPSSLNCISYGGCNWPRAKMLGGCTANNAMLWVRGNRRDFNGWALETNNSAWNYNNVTKSYEEFEDISVIRPSQAGASETASNPLKLGNYENFDASSPMLLAAAAERGFNEIDALSQTDFVGFTRQPGTLRGERISVGESFLSPIRNRPNLRVFKNSFVTKVEIEDGTAKGVVFTQNGTSFSARGRLETILSAGSINTPILLMNSGIGPANHLKELEIPVVKNLPGVGQNLQDHLIIPFVYQCRKSTAQPTPLDVLLGGWYSFLTNRTGPFAGIGPTETVGYLNTVQDRLESQYPNIQYLTNNLPKQSTNDLEGLIVALGFSEEVANSFRRALNETDLTITFVVLLNPKSKGEIRLRSSDPQDKPIIVPNYLKELEDLKTVLEGISVFRSFFNTSAFQSNECVELKVDLAACDSLEYGSNNYWECYSRQIGTTLYHPVGTTKMGFGPDSVLDSHLRVRGIKKLRVADASAMPTITSGNTQAPSTLIGWKAADFIQQGY